MSRIKRAALLVLVAAVPHGAAAQETVLELRPGAPIRLVAPALSVLPTTPWFIPAKAAGPDAPRGLAPGPGRPRARPVAKAAPKSAARAVAKTADTVGPMPAPMAAPMFAPGAKTVQAVAPPAGSAISPPGPQVAASAAPPGSLVEVIGTVLQQPLPAAAGPVPDALRAEAVVFLQGGPDLGVAAYQHDGWAILVLDQRIPIDVGQLPAGPESAPNGLLDGRWEGQRDGRAIVPRVVLGPASTVLAVPWPANQPLSLGRQATGWVMTATPDTAAARPVVPVPTDRRITLPMAQPGRAITIIDPVDGRTMLVGTARGTQGGRPLIAIAHRAPGFTLVPTALGVVVEVLADQIELRQAARGFVLSSIQDDLTPGDAEAPPASLAARFDLPALSTAALVRRLQAEQAAAAAAAPRARSAPRLAAAQSLISLGMGAEAHALLTITALDDPSLAADPGLAGLTAIAALLAGRVAEAQGLDNSALDGAADVALWRSIRSAWRDGAMTHDAALLPVALAYPAALQTRLLPTLADAASAAGDDAALALIAAIHAGPGVQLAQAMRLAQADAPGPALAQLDQLRAGMDRAVSVRAAVAAAELRLRHHEITPAQAAAVLERQSIAWRGDRQELAWRTRASALLVEAGAWRAALESLRDTARMMADGETKESGPLREQVGAVFRAMLAPGAPPVSPLDFVALSSEYADNLPDGQGLAEGKTLAEALADQLLALDLPLRARIVLKPLLYSTPAGAVRAGIGIRLAQLSLDAGAGREAEAALAASAAPDLPASMVEQRILLEARARAARDDRAGAVAQLTALGTAGADDLRANLLTQASDWRGALAALSALAAKIVPAEGPLSDAAQDVVLRQASAAVQCNDVGVLTDLRERAVPRMDDRRGGLLRLLTAPPITGSIDIARARQELALSRTVPGRLQGLAAK